MPWRPRDGRPRTARPGWTTRPSDAEITYGGAVFLRASAFVRRRDGGGPPALGHTPDTGDRRRAHGWVTDIGGAVALMRLAANLPVLDVRLTDSAAGVAIGRALAGRTLTVPRNRLCVAVFPVPDAVPDRPPGKRNQALRTALTAAARSGVAVRPVTDVRERRRLASVAAAAVPRLEAWSRTAADHTDHDWWVAEDAGRTLVGIATLVVDAEWSSLITLVGIPGSGLESHARYVLHHAVVQALSRAGVEHLAVLDHSPLLLDPGPQHLQKVLGYRLARLRRPRRVSQPVDGLSVPEPSVSGPSPRPTTASEVRRHRSGGASHASV